MLRQGSPICTRCGTRADARRGPSPICLACGQPFAITTGTPVPASLRQHPATAPAPKSSSPIVWIVIGVLGAIIVASLAAVVLIARASREDVSAPQDAALATASARLAVNAAPSSAPSSAPSVAPATRPLTDEERDELSGNYSCSLDDTPPFPCRVTGGTLEKLAGSQRFRGAVKKLPDGNLSFNGTFFCPFGDCTRPVSATFVRQGPGRYVGRFGPNPSGGAGSERVALTKVR